MKVSIRDFRFDLSALSVQLEGIVAHGQGSQSTPPLLQIENLHAGLKVDSVFRGKWHLQSLAIHHPVVHISRDNTNPEKTRSQNNADNGIAKVFDLAVDKCLIDNGEIYLNDAESRLEAELSDLQFKAGFDRTADHYQGSLGYRHGKIRYANYAPVAHSLDTKFVMTRTTLVFDKLTIADGQSRIITTGTIKDFTKPALQATYDAQVSTSDIVRILKDSSLPEGMVHTTGSVTYESGTNGSFLQNAHVAGDVSSPALRIRTQ